MYMYCPYKRAYIIVYVHKELYTFAYVVPETVVFYTTDVCKEVIMTDGRTTV